MKAKRFRARMRFDLEPEDNRLLPAVAFDAWLEFEHGDFGRGPAWKASIIGGANYAYAAESYGPIGAAMNLARRMC